MSCKSAKQSTTNSERNSQDLQSDHKPRTNHGCRSDFDTDSKWDTRVVQTIAAIYCAPSQPGHPHLHPPHCPSHDTHAFPDQLFG